VPTATETARPLFLLDTNVLLAALIAPERLADEVLAWLRDPGNEILFSAVNIWEIAIKRSLNRDGFDFMPEDIERLALETGFRELPVRAAHCHAVARMPWHHRDPFDRLLVAQAQALPARMLTTDRLLTRYSDLVTLVTGT
jgi:PIN domain nuclease of toxin-antitoxin system